MCVTNYYSSAYDNVNIQVLWVKARWSALTAKVACVCVCVTACSAKIQLKLCTCVCKCVFKLTSLLHSFAAAVQGNRGNIWSCDLVWQCIHTLTSIVPDGLVCQLRRMYILLIEEYRDIHTCKNTYSAAITRPVYVCMRLSLVIISNANCEREREKEREKECVIPSSTPSLKLGILIALFSVKYLYYLSSIYLLL